MSEVFVVDTELRKAGAIGATPNFVFFLRFSYIFFQVSVMCNRVSLDFTKCVSVYDWNYNKKKLKKIVSKKFSSSYEPRISPHIEEGHILFYIKKIYLIKKY